MDDERARSAKPLFIVVHGVGRQLELETLRSFIEGSTADFEFPSTHTRARLADELRDRGEIAVEGIPVVFREFNYAKEIAKHAEYAEQDPRKWIKSFRNRLREMNRDRGGPDDETFIDLQNVVDDILFATTLSRLAADRFRLQTPSLNHAAVAFLEQVQLYLDRHAYREEINCKFQAFMEDIVTSTADGTPRLTLVAHSLGTVVVFRAILQAAMENRKWVNAVDRFITFGSPIDLLLLLFPNLFDVDAATRGCDCELRTCPSFR